MTTQINKYGLWRGLASYEKFSFILEFVIYYMSQSGKGLHASEVRSRITTWFTVDTHFLIDRHWMILISFFKKCPLVFVIFNKNAENIL
jgi:hypothetical protein